MDNHPKPTREELARMYDAMVTSRAFEEFMTEAYLEGKQPVFDFTAGPLPGEMHVSTGQEPCAAGVCIHLRDTDHVTAPHRLHHIAIAKGLNLKTMAAEIFGKQAGLSGGRGGHMHLIDPQKGFWSTGIVGQGLGVSVGQALAEKVKGTDNVAVAFIGEGAANQGMFHEALNLAGLWKLPLVVIIEDNNWAVSVSKEKSTAIARNSDRAQGYGIVGEFVPGNDLWGIYSVAKIAIDRARAGEGPTLIEIETYRLAGHFVGDIEPYVPDAEKQTRSDAIEVTGQRLIGEGLFAPPELDDIRAKASQAVEDARRFAFDADDPDPDQAFVHVFASSQQGQG